MVVSGAIWPDGGEKIKEAMLPAIRLSNKAQAAQHWACCIGVMGQRLDTLSPAAGAGSCIFVQQ